MYRSEPEKLALSEISRVTPAPMRYLVFALQGFGDALEATPMLAALRGSDASAEIDVVVTRVGTAHLFRKLPALVTRVIELPYWQHGAAAFAAQLAAHAWRRSYAASFMAYPAAKPAYHLVNAAFRAHRKYGHRYAAPAFTNGLRSYSDLVPIRAIHNVERNLDLIAAAGIASTTSVRYAAPVEWNAGYRDRNRVTVHIGTIAHDGFENKRWPLEKFAAVAGELRASGYALSLLAGPDEVAETRALAELVPGAELFIGSLDEAALHLSSSALVLTNDSGIGHLSAALETPVISLFGPTPTTGAPYGPWSHPMRTSPCPPCFHPLSRGISCVLDIDYRCLKRDLTVDEVVKRARGVLAREAVDA